MATAAKAVYPHITKNPDICSGRACVAGTRIRVMDIVALRGAGVSPEEIVQEFPSLESTIDVYAALVYYADHKDEIDADFAEDQGLAAKAERERIGRTRPCASALPAAHGRTLPDLRHRAPTEGRAGGRACHRHSRQGDFGPTDSCVRGRKGLVWVTSDEPAQRYPRQYLKEGRPFVGMLVWTQENRNRMRPGHFFRQLQALEHEENPFASGIRHIQPE